LAATITENSEITTIFFKIFYILHSAFYNTHMPFRFLPHIFLLCCLVLLSGCAPDFTSPENTGLSEPQLQDTVFISYDGTGLPLRVWQPSDGMSASRFIFIAVHGFNDYSNFIKRSAPYFTRQRITVYAYDQRGFGNAPEKGRWSSTKAMAQDLKILIRLIAQKHPDLPIYVLGHSMGGAVIIRAMSGENLPDVAGAILVAPAVWGRSTIPFYQNAALWLMAHTIPWYKVTGESLDRKPSDNIEMLREQGRDPLVIKETRFDTIYGLQNLMDAAYKAAPGFNIKSLVLYGNHDEIIPEKPVLDVFRNFPNEPAKQKKLIRYENGYHMLLRDLQAENVLKDIVAWLHD
jgi:alpha-beta hydrolase superfamily lysophospholipase